MDRAALSDAATAFLACASPAAWLEAAAEDLATVLIDHAKHYVIAM